MQPTLHSNYHRYYSPELGRYLNADPIGQAGGVNVYRYALNNPSRFFDPFGLEEGSPSNKRKREAIARWAEEQWSAAQRGDTDFSTSSSYAPGYSYDSVFGPQYPAGSNKCSAMTCAAAAAADADTKVTVPDGRGGTVDRCPTAAELADGEIPDWRLLKPGEKPEPGDFVASPLPGRPVNATGHAAVVVSDPSDPKGGTTTIGAHSWGVGPPGADGFYGPRSYRRYTGD